MLTRDLFEVANLLVNFCTAYRVRFLVFYTVTLEVNCTPALSIGIIKNSYYQTFFVRVPRIFAQ